jgi:hypothetical protein
VVAGVAAIALIATRPRRILRARRDPALA